MKTVLGVLDAHVANGDGRGIIIVGRL